MAEYFQVDSLNTQQQYGFRLDYRAALAIVLIERFGAVAGKRVENDSEGRPVADLQTPRELVERCCEIAELTVAELEKHDWLRPVAPLSDEDRYVQMGVLESIKSEASYRRIRENAE